MASSSWQCQSVRRIGNGADCMRIGTEELVLYSSTDIELHVNVHASMDEDCFISVALNLSSFWECILEACFDVSLLRLCTYAGNLKKSNGHLNVVKLLHNEPWQWFVGTEEDGSQLNSLHVAASNSRADIVWLLLNLCPILVRNIDENGYSPLHYAAKFLTTYGETVFHLAARI
ncbi:hypothetical protein Q3G72_020141 [Acer saccharum]|nr:hypothetical protein Q3G72_020141 [Acer saccharum]